MGVRTAEQYRKGLIDDRTIVYRGRRVIDVEQEPDIRSATDRCALCFSIAADRPALAIRDGYSAFYHLPRSREDLIARSELLQEISRRGAGAIVLKEVGSDALFALLRTCEGEGLDRIRAFYQRCLDDDLALAVAQTDVKGNRSLTPSQQADPDLYLRIVASDADSITVRGAKAQTTYSPNADEIVVLPTRAMGRDDADYAVSFAIPPATPGLTLYVSPYSAGQRNEFEFPLSSRHRMLESLTVFDDVRIPRERVFMERQWEMAGPLTLAFVDFHRHTAINYKLPFLDLMLGAANLVADANGISHAGHVRDKLARMVAWTETVRGLAELSNIRALPDDRGVWRPDPLVVNLAKYTFAHGYPEAAATLVDLAGGLLVTGPGAEDWADPSIRPVLEKYYAGAVPGERRLRIANLVADLTVRDYGGYQTSLNSHAEGSLEAEKMQMIRSFDPGSAMRYAEELAGLVAVDRTVADGVGHGRSGEEDWPSVDRLGCLPLDWSEDR
ncbi:4-hydroxyphenylacetate 3-hydroxylase N-terminal domain-containing protein [Nocardia jiangxiensis]|uniref:4-hydroxyphenylacetate 3-hydroxylase N-terminal domain-containing protein n=1 Tax=Nocardia jiangxiensis TaxID=282685 RepID=A0ABW6SE21_9NOCA|nr:4-hydroxyphenylacetate 3-hydroxylase N-terminal domain-containing protein [Nocardia jiangxiensis]